MTGSRMVVVIPVGPNDTAVDTLQSVFCYADPELVIIIDDTHGHGVHFSHDKVITLPAVAHGSHGELWVNLATAFRYAVEGTKFDVLLRLDTDALLLGPGLAEAAATKFKENPEIGALGAYRFGCDGGARDWTPARRILRADMGFRGLRYRSCRRVLRDLMTSAPGYISGEHALGGAVIYRGEMIREMHRRDLLDFPELANSHLGEDHIFGLITVAAGYRTGDFSQPRDPMAVRWRGLPSAPAELLKAGKLVTHSIRSWEGMSEQEIREYFVAARG